MKEIIGEAIGIDFNEVAIIKKDSHYLGMDSKEYFITFIAKSGVKEKVSYENDEKRRDERFKEFISIWKGEKDR